MGRQAKLKAQRRVDRAKMMVRSREAHDAHMRDPAFLVELDKAQPPQVLAMAAVGQPAQTERLERAGWRQRAQARDGLGVWDHSRRLLRLVHSLALEADGEVWAHLSVSQRDDILPSWYEVRDAQWLVYPDRPGVIVVAPESEHVNLANVHHVWTCLTRPAVPDFRHLGEI